MARRRNSDERLVLALACGATVEAAARQAGVSESTAFRRLANPDFRRRLNDLRADMVGRATATLTAASLESVKTLVALQSTSTPPATRLGAARAVLELAVKFRELVEFEGRLAMLERRMDGAAA